MDIGLHLYTVIIFFSNVHFGLGFRNLAKLFAPKDALLNFTQLANEYGHSAEEYNVITEDGYILGVFRIPGFKNRNVSLVAPPVLLMHGILDSADTWLLRGEGSLAIALADAGHDVWAGNARGNRYSRRHVRLDPDSDPEFWDFSFNEYGSYDLPSVIDFVLSKTGAAKLNAIGHSQGNTIFYVMGSTRPDYNRKVNSLIALAPVCFLQHVHKALASLIKISPVLVSKARSKGYLEVPGKAIAEYIAKFCGKPITGYFKCVIGTVFPVTGYDAQQLEPSFVRVAVGHYPTGTSLKNLFHFAQVGLRGKFSRFDYGANQNVEVYGSVSPPDYDLGLVTMPVVLLVGDSDYIAVLADVETLRARLPNVAELSLVRHESTNHLDFIWGRDMKEYLFSDIFRILNRFR